jgi:hypothetical protein
MKIQRVKSVTISKETMISYVRNSGVPEGYAVSAPLVLPVLFKLGK